MEISFCVWRKGDLHFTKFRRQRIKRFFSFKKIPNLLPFALILTEKLAKEYIKLIQYGKFCKFSIFGYLPGIYLINVHYARKSSAKQFVATRLTPQMGLITKFLIFG
jgi:hypothetical protein